jgi:16S rRNA (adenine1518-N6/adenine1519-N6)-dimethyltransferase
LRAGRPRLSQHFLHDRRTAARIADSLRAPAGARVLEIGPGRGALTEHLLDRGWSVAAVELDPELAAALERRWPGRDLTVVRGDALDYEPQGEGPLYVIGNLPYAVTSPLLFHLLDLTEGIEIPEIVVMVQREVADRLAASPGTKAYGALTVGILLSAEVEVLFQVGRGQFRPPPKVRSTVVRLVPGSPAGLGADRRERVRRLVRTAFEQRRKQLRNSLRAELEPVLAKAGAEGGVAGIDLERRPETLSVEEWIRLEAALAEGSS